MSPQIVPSEPDLRPNRGEDIDLDYVSCSPYRVPVARLAAAQAHLRLNERPR